jgi:ATP-dependent RNA helicase DDX52/ROK1
MVINYDFPQSTTDYVHRIGKMERACLNAPFSFLLMISPDFPPFHDVGRTGRAGRVGEAVTYFTEDDLPMVRSVANVIRLSGGEVPDWMLSLKKMGNKKRKYLLTHAPERRTILTSQKANKFGGKKKKQVKKGGGGGKDSKSNKGE